MNFVKTSERIELAFRTYLTSRHDEFRVFYSSPGENFAANSQLYIADAGNRVRPSKMLITFNTRLRFTALDRYCR